MFAYMYHFHCYSTDCQCGRNIKWHRDKGLHVPEDVNTDFIQHKEIWHYHTHAKELSTDSFGVIQFQGFGQDAQSAPVRFCLLSIECIIKCMKENAITTN